MRTIRIRESFSLDASQCTDDLELSERRQFLKAPSSLRTKANRIAVIVACKLMKLLTTTTNERKRLLKLTMLCRASKEKKGHFVKQLHRPTASNRIDQPNRYLSGKATKNQEKTTAQKTPTVSRLMFFYYYYFIFS